MDPQACLDSILESLSGDTPFGAQQRELTVERLRALADWLEHGGFPPEALLEGGSDDT